MTATDCTARARILVAIGIAKAKHEVLVELANGKHKKMIVARMAHIPLDAGLQKYRRAGAALRDAILRQQHAHQLPSLPHPQSFFNTSCNIRLSSVGHQILD